MTNARFSLASLFFFAVVAFFAQFIIEFEVINIAACCIVLFSSLLVIAYLSFSESLKTHPLSTFSMLGFCMTTQLGALIAQSAYLTPLVQDLREPIITFSVLAVAQCTALLVHYFYRLFDVPMDEGKSAIRSGLNWFNIYKTPSPMMLWLMGIVGFVGYAIGQGGDDTFSKVNQGLNFLTWAPFLIPMYLLQEGEHYCNRNRHYVFMAVYVVLIFIFAMAVNARGLMFSGFVAVALFMFLTALRSSEKLSQKLVVKLVIGSVVLGLLSIPFVELATAMVVARKVRATASAAKMIEDTIYYLQQPEVLKDRRELDKLAARNSKYDETYLSNPLLARLVETKFHDNILYFGLRLSDSDKLALEHTSFDMIIAILPEPVINLLGLKVKKQDLIFSMGDYIAYLSIGATLGEFKTGSVLAQGFVLFGFSFVFIYAILCLLMYKVIDLQCYVGKNGRIVVSALGMLAVWKYFQYGITADSLHYMISNVVRTLPQNVLLYSLTYWLASRLIALFPSGKTKIA